MHKKKGRSVFPWKKGYMKATRWETGSGLLPFTLMETSTSLLLSHPKLPPTLRDRIASLNVTKTSPLANHHITLPWGKMVIFTLSVTTVCHQCPQSLQETERLLPVYSHTRKTSHRVTEVQFIQFKYNRCFSTSASLSSMGLLWDSSVGREFSFCCTAQWSCGHQFFLLRNI